jgi:sulfate adenylyltransferase subunit 1
MPWYTRPSLLSHLEQVEVEKDIDLAHARFPVQYVIRPQTEDLHDYRGYAGKIISGIYRTGDRITVLPSGLNSVISRIEHNLKDVEEAHAPQSIVLHLQDDIDVSRGDVIVKDDQPAHVSNELHALLCWMDTKPLIAGNKYQLQLNSTRVRAIVKEVAYKVDVNSLENVEFDGSVNLNEVVKVTIKTAVPLPHDYYTTLRVNGGAILIDETSNITVGACMLLAE